MSSCSPEIILTLQQEVASMQKNVEKQRQHHSNDNDANQDRIKGMQERNKEMTAVIKRQCDEMEQMNREIEDLRLQLRHSQQTLDILKQVGIVAQGQRLEDVVAERRDSSHDEFR
jgi:TPP-dependent indolepyruvate ferredoxin oxidoreductase alpha subunit